MRGNSSLHTFFEGSCVPDLHTFVQGARVQTKQHLLSSIPAKQHLLSSVPAKQHLLSSVPPKQRLLSSLQAELESARLPGPHSYASVLSSPHTTACDCDSLRNNFDNDCNHSEVDATSVYAYPTTAPLWKLDHALPVVDSYSSSSSTLHSGATKV
jgi:hypothetical protein